MTVHELAFASIAIADRAIATLEARELAARFIRRAYRPSC